MMPVALAPEPVKDVHLTPKDASILTYVERLPNPVKAAVRDHSDDGSVNQQMQRLVRVVRRLRDELSSEDVRDIFDAGLDIQSPR